MKIRNKRCSCNVLQFREKASDEWNDSKFLVSKCVDNAGSCKSFERKRYGKFVFLSCLLRMNFRLTSNLKGKLIIFLEFLSKGQFTCLDPASRRWPKSSSGSARPRKRIRPRADVESVAVWSCRGDLAITDSKVKFIVLVISRTRFHQGVQVVYLYAGSDSFYNRLLVTLLRGAFIWSRFRKMWEIIRIAVALVMQAWMVVTSTIFSLILFNCFRKLLSEHRLFMGESGFRCC